jgi:DNA repair protein RecO (recombination protein O)
LCDRCLAKKELGAIAVPVPRSVLTAMRYIVYCEPKKLFSFTLSEQGYEVLQTVAEGYLLAQLEHRFPTLAFYKSIT